MRIVKLLTAVVVLILLSFGILNLVKDLGRQFDSADYTFLMLIVFVAAAALDGIFKKE